MINLPNRTIRDYLIAVGFSIIILLTVPSQTIAQDATISQAETQATQFVVRDQLNAFKSGDLNRAYFHAAPDIKNYFTSVDRFASMVKKRVWRDLSVRWVCYGPQYHCQR